MKMGFLRPKKEEECFLALDVGTEVAKALIFKKENQKRVILGAASQYFDHFLVFDGESLKLDVFKKTISGVIEEAVKRVGEKPKGVFLGLPANILRGKIHPQFLTRKTPKIAISQKEEEQIYQTVLKEAQKAISQEFAKTSGILPQDVQFVVLEILDKRIDGYEIPSLLGFTGKELAFRILATFSLKYYLEDFKNLLQKLDFKILKVTHGVQSLTKAFKEESAIFLDVGGKITQVFLMKDGKLQRVQEFEIGGNDFSQALSQVLGLNIDRARFLKERYSAGELSEKARKRIREILSGTLEEWFGSLKSRLSGFKDLLPSDIFLFGGGSQLPEIQEILNEGDWGNLPFTGSPEAEFISLNQLKVEDQTHTLNNPKDINILLLCYES